ncbi:MAG: serine/threonine-protein kinase [Aromatoleum sp.]|uniref:serine/threonine-protein kinase n=1 Tax=Aromatoleum sp. TaxID=2307007 RepID=UPI002894DF6B|nr:serine/threonine-protein kinase [Aromatoleum sp.]MDT3672936.1 serine/threonine-protein kinase [Aromatoleum sp.]MDT3737246.1 serine/threonine-protein kinase [Denitratisoma sp.]
MTDLKKLGKYEIRGELGQGAMGIVYDGFDPMIGRRVALKTVRRDQLDRTEVEEILARFKREAQAAGRLNHPNIVQIYEYGEDEGTAFIAMEFVEGRELKDYFDADERFPMAEIVRIMGQLLEALDYSHKNGVVHRDIKPANIILLKDGTVKVADFGIARVESSNLTQAGSVLGTPSYMSPEQFMGQTVDGRSDLFSAGVILYQFLTGEKPFTGALTTIMHKVLKEEPAAPSALNVQVPRPFDALIRKALAKRPDERFQNGREFAIALKMAAAGQAVPGDGDATLVNDAEATLAMERPAASPKAAAPAAAATPAPAKKSSPGLALALVAGIAVVGLGAAAYVFMGKGDAPQPAATPAAAPAQAGAPAAPANGGIMVISALGLADPSDPRYQNDKGLLNADLREDARRQLVEKALGLYVEQGSLAKNYALVRDKLLARSGEFIQAVLEEQPPQLGKDGLMSLATRATVRVRDVQKSLNQMSREERVEFIRNNGDPKISVAITAKSAEGDPAAPAQRSPVAENLLKERIHSFGFRLWNDDMAKDGKGGADFAVTGEAKFRKLSAKLAASGITVEKFVLTSWTVKATDKRSGEEIYYNTQIPEKTSWATEDEALRDIGRLIGEEFSKGFFLSHFHFSGQKVRLRLQGLPNKDTAELVMRELNGLHSVLAASLASGSASDAVFDVVLSGGLANLEQLVQAGILKPLNHKLGKQCFNAGAGSGGEIVVMLEAGCKDAAVLSRLDTLPPASLIEAPQSRREAVVKNPETLKKISI